MLSRGNAVGRAVPWENGSDSKTSVPFIRFCFGGKSAFFGTLVPLATLVPLGPSVFPILSLLGYRSLLALLCTHEIRLLWLNLMRMASCSQTHNVSLFGKRLKLQNFKIEKTSKFQNLKNSKTPKTSKLQTQRRPWSCFVFEVPEFRASFCESALFQFRAFLVALKWRSDLSMLALGINCTCHPMSSICSENNSELPC